MSLIPQQGAFLSDVARLIQYANNLGLYVTGDELYRPQILQQIYFDQGKSKTLHSRHGMRLAIDLYFFRMGDDEPLTDEGMINMIASYWKSLNPNNVWGGDFPGLHDTPHFERGHL